MIKIFLGLLATVFLTTASATAQQAPKVTRIGFLDNSTASGSAVLWDAFRQELSKLGWIEEKNIASNTDLQSKSLNGYLSLRRTWFV